MKKGRSNKKKALDDNVLSSYTNMSSAVGFFLSESFRHLENEMKHHIANEFFGRRIRSIDATDKDRQISNDFASKLTNPLDAILSDHPALSDETLTKLVKAWVQAQREAEQTDLKFPVTKELSGTDLLGHISNFAFVIEALVNRHLFVLTLNKKIDDFTFNSLDKSTVVNKILFLFKTEIALKEFNPEKLAGLFKLRNLAVHFTRDNSKRFRTCIAELFEIWKESGKLIKLMEKKEGVKDPDSFHLALDEHIRDFVARFAMKKRQKSA